MSNSVISVAAPATTECKSSYEAMALIQAVDSDIEFWNRFIPYVSLSVLVCAMIVAIAGAFASNGLNRWRIVSLSLALAMGLGGVVASITASNRLQTTVGHLTRINEQLITAINALEMSIEGKSEQEARPLLFAYVQRHAAVRMEFQRIRADAWSLPLPPMFATNAVHAAQ